MSEPETLCEVTLPKDRETKGTVLYTSGNPGSPVRNIYVSKNVMSAPYPEDIRVTVQTVPK